MPYSHIHSLDSIMEVVATAGSTAVSNFVRAIDVEAGVRHKMQRHGLRPSPHLRTCHSFSHIIDQLNKEDAQPIPETDVYLLCVQCLVSLCNGLIRYVLPLQFPRGPESPRITGTRPRTKPSRHFDTTQIRAGPCGPA